MRTATKPTPAALRRRLSKIAAQAAELEDLVKRWDPKGRHFTTRRDLATFATPCRQTAEQLLRRLETPKISQKRLARGLAIAQSRERMKLLSPPV